jgi:hypothetical protein
VDGEMPRMLIFFSKVAYKPQMTLEQARRGFDFRSAIEEAINPDNAVSRYNRTWRVSQPTYIEKFFVGKLGFMSSATETRTYYDESKKDFIEQPVDSRQGHYVQWAIDTSTQIIAFESKPPDIKYQSFIGAFKGLLDERSDIGLTIENILESAQFFEWVGEVDRITKFTASLRAPNPDYVSRTKIVQELLEDTNADSAKVEINKAKGSEESLNTEKTIRDLVEYGEQGYSTIVARGLKKGRSKLFDSKRRMPVERVDISGPISVDKIWHYIINELKKFQK